jgi:hypothetical protein
MERVSWILALSSWNKSILTGEQRVWWSARAGARSLDAGRRRAYALLRLLAHSCILVDAVEHRELDHDGRRHGCRQLSGSFLLPRLLLFKPLFY